MAKIYSTEGKILTGDNFPQIQIENELYVVDNRKSTYDKIQKVITEQQTDPKAGKNYDIEIFNLALGKEQTKKIEKMDLSVKSFSELTIYIMAAIQEEEYETIKEAMLSIRLYCIQYRIHFSI